MKIDAKTILGAVASVALLYVSVYYGGKAWKKSQED